MNLQPDGFQGYCFTTIDRKVQKFFFASDYPNSRLMMQNLDDPSYSWLPKERFVEVDRMEVPENKVFKFKIVFLD